MNCKFYDIAATILRPIYGLLWHSKIVGAENIPAEGGFILCSNHMHWRDPLFLATKLRKRRYTFLAKIELFRNKLFTLILGEKGLGGIPINRGHTDLSAIRKALKTVSDGHGLGIFPQGSRSRDNTPTPMLNGASMIAVRAGVPIIPVYIDGPYHLFHRVDITVGAPIDISDLGKRYDSETLTEVTHRIENAIWSLRKPKKEA